MSDLFYAELQGIKKSRRNQNIIIMVLSLLFIGLCVLGFFVFLDMKKAEQDASQKIHALGVDKGERNKKIDNLETALNNQRNQFQNCKDKKPNFPGCTQPVSPAAEKIGPQGVQGLQGIPGPGPSFAEVMSAVQRVYAANPPPPGKNGVNGLNGRDGESIAGPVGPQGEKGDKGDKGDTGAPGAPGTVPDGTYACPSGEYMTGLVVTAGQVQVSCSGILGGPSTSSYIYRSTPLLMRSP